MIVLLVEWADGTVTCRRCGGRFAVRKGEVGFYEEFVTHVPVCAGCARTAAPALWRVWAIARLHDTPVGV